MKATLARKGLRKKPFKLSLETGRLFCFFSKVEGRERKGYRVIGGVRHTKISQTKAEEGGG